VRLLNGGNGIHNIGKEADIEPADEVPAGDQSQDRKDARVDDPPVGSRASGSGD